MEAFILLGGFAVMAVFGYYIMSRLDNFLDTVQKENERQDERLCLCIATASPDAIPTVSNILKEIRNRYPDVQCRISFGEESAVLRAVEAGTADVAILSAEASDSIQAQWKCISLDQRPFFVDNGTVEIRSIEERPRLQKILWKSADPHFLVLEFIQQLCGQQPWSVI